MRCRQLASLVACSGLFVVAVTLFLAFGTYTEEPTEYRRGDVFRVGMAPLASRGSVVPWAYYSYPFPRGPGFRSARQAFWDAFVSLYTNGDSGFRHVAWEEPAGCYAQSTLTNDTEMFYDALQLQGFARGIRAGYRVQLYVDGVRSVSRDPGGGWWWGFEMGAVLGHQVLLYNHVDLNIDLDPAGRVVRVVAEPRHTQSLALCAAASDVPNHPVDVVRWSYRTRVRVTDSRRRDMAHLYDTLLNADEERIGYVMFGLVVAVFAVALVVFGFVVWRICARNRFDMDELHRLTTPVAPDLIDLGSGSGSDVEIELEPRPPGSTRYYLARVRGAVLGRPRWARTLALLVSSAAQLVVVVFFAMLLALLYQHAWNNTYQTIVIILLPTTGGVAGLVNARLLRAWRVRNSICAHLGTTVVITLPLYTVFFMVTSMQMLYHDSATIAGLFFVLLGMLVVNGLTYASGVWVAHEFPPAARPEAALVLPRPCWVRRYGAGAVSCAVVSLLQGFGAVCVAVLVLSTPWTTRVKQQLWFGLLLLVFWLATGALLTVIATYLTLIYGRHPWWQWGTYAMGLGTGGVVFVFSCLYTFTTVAFVDDASYAAVVVYLVVASALTGLVAAATGWLATYVFFARFIYGRIVIKD